MNKFIEQYQKELIEVAGFARSTVDTYSSSITAFGNFTEKSYRIDLLAAKGKHLQAWLKTLRPSNSRSRLRQHQYALKSYYNFLYKHGVIEKNPAESLPQLKRKTNRARKPIPAREAFRLLAVIDRSNWLGQSDQRQL